MKNKQNFICSKCGSGFTLEYIMCPRCGAILSFKKPQEEKPVFKSQVELFNYVWQSRPHVSEISGRSLEDIPDHLKNNIFAHILPKSKYPKFKLNPDNIILLHNEEHFLEHFGTKDDRNRYAAEYGADWSVIETRKQELLKQYNSGK